MRKHLNRYYAKIKRNYIEFDNIAYDLLGLLSKTLDKT